MSFCGMVGFMQLRHSGLSFGGHQFGAPLSMQQAGHFVAAISKKKLLLVYSKVQFGGFYPTNPAICAMGTGQYQNTYYRVYR